MRLTKLYQNFFSRQNVGKQLMTLFICTILIPILMIGGIIICIPIGRHAEL